VITIENGCGGADLPRLERPLARPDGDGAGLGLSIAKGLVEAHAGRTTLEPTERGCRFSIILPERSESGGARHRSEVPLRSFPFGRGV
jgi:nitrogen-specific signal transduction histidine kinase